MDIRKRLVGVVTNIKNDLAFVWIESKKMEATVAMKASSVPLSLADWIEVVLLIDNCLVEFQIIRPVLETKIFTVLGTSIVQVKTTLIFKNSPEVSSRGYLVESLDFGQVAAFSPYDEVVLGQKYEGYVERMPRESRELLELSLRTAWILSLEQKVTPKEDIRQRYSKLGNNETVRTRFYGNRRNRFYKGVVVSSRLSCALIWSPALGELPCTRPQELQVGDWISFFPQAVPFGGHIIECWEKTEPILKSYRSNTSIVLETTLYEQSQLDFQRDKLVARWVGRVYDLWALLPPGIGRLSASGVKINIQVKYIEDETSEYIWNVSKLLTSDPSMAPLPVLRNTSAISEDRFFAGIVVGSQERNISIWSPQLDEVRCRWPGNLKIGDWVRFKVRDHENIAGQLDVTEWRRMDPLFETVRAGSTVEVYISMNVPSSLEMADGFPTCAFFGKLSDRNRVFRDGLDSLRGKKNIGLWIRRVKDSNRTVWNITRLKVLEMMANESDVPVVVGSGKELGCLLADDEEGSVVVDYLPQQFGE